MDYTTIRGLIFDCDGTLVDSESISLTILIGCVAELGLQLDHTDTVKRFAGKELSAVFREIESQLGRALPDDFLQRFREQQIQELKSKVEAIDGAADLLETLRLPYCLASNAPLDKIDVCLKTSGLAHFFSDETRFSAYTIEKWKPAPDLFLLASRAIGVPSGECGVVEDSHFGIEAGLAAGMHVFALGPHGRRYAETPQVTLIPSLRHLTAYLS